MIDPALKVALGKVSAVTEKLGLWQKLLAKLLGDPDLAAQHLGVALSEVRRTLSSLRDTILEISYLGVQGQDPVDVRRALDRIELGQLKEDIIRAKGSCHKIGNIYDRHLEAWFKRLLKPDEASELRKLFKKLRDSDGWAIDVAEHLLIGVKPLAREVRGLLENGDEVAAQQKVTKFTRGLRPTLQKLSTTIAVMLDLESHFVQQQHLT